MTDVRRLVVLRHARAEQFAASDHDRVLAPRGRADAAAAGRWLSAAGIVPDHVVISSAARTQGTWTCLAEAAGYVAEAQLDRALYSAGIDGALEVLRETPEDATCVLLVGHNPTVASLVHLLDDGGADPAVFARVAEGYPTSALTVLDVPCAWSALEVGAARIADFHVARG